jgi:tetratricopeptide (TPR) repeat protein
VAATILTSWSRFATPGIFTAAPDLQSVGPGLRSLTAFASLGYFAGRLVWPMHLTPNLPPLLLDSPTLVALALYAVLAVAALYWAWHYRRSKPGFALAVIGAGALALPCLGLTELPTWPVDRYSYLVDIVLAGGLAGMWLTSPDVPRTRLAAVLAVLLVFACVPVTRAQLHVWEDSEALFSHMERDPRFARHPRQQGHVYVLWGNYEASQGQTARATELWNRAQQVYLAAIRAAVARGDYPDALSLTTHLERYFPLTPVMLREKGAWLLRLGHEAEAIEQLKMARKAAPDDPRTQSLLNQAGAEAAGKREGERGSR